MLKKHVALTFSNRFTSSSSLGGGRYSLDKRFLSRFLTGLDRSGETTLGLDSRGIELVLFDSRSACTRWL